MSDSSRQKKLFFCSGDIKALFQEVLAETRYSSVFVLTDSNTRQACWPVLKTSLPLDPVKVITIPAGEAGKDISTCMGVWRKLTAAGADRSSLLINLGGGVVTDLGGFVACTFKRGIDFINFPTSLLAMVDASVGGKTGVDLDGLKNQVGVIRQPKAVFIDPVFLQTLPEREFKAGMAEMLKHGLITSRRHWEELMGFAPDSPGLESLIRESVRIKQDITTRDPNEMGDRKKLNFGHTVGHAIETHFLNSRPENKQLLHGEAVAAGLVVESMISTKMLDLPTADLEQIKGRILPLFPRPELDKNDIQEVIKLMAHDKKNRDGQTLYVLIERIGRAVIDKMVPEDVVNEALNKYAEL